MTLRPPYNSDPQDGEPEPEFSVPPLQPDEVDRPLPDVPPPLEEIDITWAQPSAPRAPTPFTTWLARGWRLTMEDVGGAILAGLAPTIAGVLAMGLAAGLAYPLVWGQPLRGAGAVIQALVLAGLVLLALPATAAVGAAGFLRRMGMEASGTARPVLVVWPSVMGVLLPFWLCGALAAAVALRLGAIGVPLCLLIAVPLSAWACLGLYEVVGRGGDVATALLAAWHLLATDPVNVCGLGAAGIAIGAASVAMCCAGVPVAVPVLLTAWAAAHEDLTERR
jgi:hypothetical protein